MTQKYDLKALKLKSLCHDPNLSGGGVGAPLNLFKPSSKLFTDRSKAALLLWIVCVISVCFVVPSCTSV